MFHDITVYTLPFVAAIIGYVTNFIAVKMLFHPRKVISLLGLKIQGVFPKRKALVAKSIGALVARRLLSVESIVENIKTENIQGGIESAFAPRIDAFLKERLPEKLPMISMFLSDSLLDGIRETLLEELKKVGGAHLGEVLHFFLKDLNIEAIVEKRVLDFSDEELESALNEILKKEFRFIELVGGVLGFFIGLVQVGLIYLPKLNF